MIHHKVDHKWKVESVDARREGDMVRQVKLEVQLALDPCWFGNSATFTTLPPLGST